MTKHLIYFRVYGVSYNTRHYDNYHVLRRDATAEFVKIQTK